MRKNHKDLSINKEKLINPHFDCLVESNKLESQNSNSFITILFCYIKETNKSETIIDINNLNIIIGLDSILRLYLFSMYHYEKYCEMCEEVEKNNPNAERIKEEERQKNLEYIRKKQEEGINMRFFDKVKSNYQSRNTSKISIGDKEKNINQNKDKKDDISNKLEDIIEEDEENKADKEKIKRQLKNLVKMRYLYGIKEKVTKTEHIKAILKVTVNMNDTVLKMPLDASKIDTPIFSINFDMTYIQEWRQEMENVYEMPNKKLIKQDYSINDNNMNSMVYKADMDLIYYVLSQNKFTHNPITEKLLSNFRITCQIKSYIVPVNSISVMNIDVLFEQLLLNFGFRQIRKLIQLYNDSMKFYYTVCKKNMFLILNLKILVLKMEKNKLK